MARKVKAMQRNWIGKSIGAEIEFKINSMSDKIKVFTTRPDTIYGASFIAVSINHKIVSYFMDKTKIQEVRDQFNSSVLDHEKIGIPLGADCVNPVTNENIPIYIANFVLDNYGEGAIFGCPAHDERDFEFAQKYQLPIKKVVQCEDSELPYVGDGILINSPLLDGLNKDDAISEIIKFLEKNKIGNKSINYKIRDWGVSRQRYWGCPTSYLL